MPPDHVAHDFGAHLPDSRLTRTACNMLVGTKDHISITGPITCPACRYELERELREALRLLNKPSLTSSDRYFLTRSIGRWQRRWGLANNKQRTTP